MLLLPHGGGTRVSGAASLQKVNDRGTFPYHCDIDRAHLHTVAQSDCTYHSIAYQCIPPSAPQRVEMDESRSDSAAVTQAEHDVGGTNIGTLHDKAAEAPAAGKSLARGGDQHEVPAGQAASGHEVANPPHAGVTGAGSAEALPTGAPHFVAPSSYLRPLSSRAAPSTSGPAGARSASGTGSGSGSRPGTRQGEQMSSPLDREQIEGLVSRVPDRPLIVSH